MSAPETNCTCYSPFSASDDHWRRCPARLELSPDEAAIVAKFEAAEPAPESYVQQHRAEGDCFCQPVEVGQDAWQHKP